jgi:MFS family permease
MQTDVEQQRAGQHSRFINPNFQRLWFGLSLSGLGDSIFEVTLTVWIASKLAEGRDWSALAVTGLLVASAIPVLLVGPIAGALIDRWPNKRRVMLRADLMSAGLILLLIPAAQVISIPGVDDLPLWWRLGAIFLVVLLASAVAQFFRPASSVLTRDIVPAEDLPRASSLFQASSNFTILIGPSLAAPVLFAFGAAWALLFNALSFIASFLLVRSMRYAPPGPESPEDVTATPQAIRDDIRDGFRFFVNSPAFSILAVSFVVVMIGLGAMNTLEIFFVTENLSAPAKYFGFMVSVQGAAMVVGSLLWGRVIERIGPPRAFWIGIIGIGIGTMIYARLTSFEAGLVASAAFGLVVPAVNVSMGPIMYRLTPREYIGRVSATLNPLIQGSMMIGLFGGGLLYSTVMRNFSATFGGVHFGPIDTIYLGVGILCILGGLNARRLRLPETPAE